MNYAAFDTYLKENHDRLIEDYKDFVRQPSVAATGQGMIEMAAIVARRLAGLGFDVKVVPTEGNFPPVVWAELGDGPRELLIYNHYDVQPAEPFDLWESPPFEPTIRDGKMFGRGVLDDKGELVARIHAIEAWLKTQGPLPFKIKWLIEGEEEISSPHLHAWVERHTDWLHKPNGSPLDGCIWEFGGYTESGRNKLTFGVKGICYVELHAKTVDHDLHSSLAAIAPNAAWRLVWALSTLKDQSERIQLDGYYDHVRAPTPAEEEILRDQPFEEAAMKAKWKVDSFVTGVTGYDAVKRLYFQPTCTIAGITTGWQGTGAKTVMPAHASAKIDFRLVPNLTPEIVVDSLRRHLDKHGFQDIEIKLLGGYRSEISDVTAPIVQASKNAVRRVEGVDPEMELLSPGSGPMYSLSSFIGGVPVVCLGFGHPDARIHSPNEHILLDYYYKGMRHFGVFVDEFGKI